MSDSHITVWTTESTPNTKAALPSLAKPVAQSVTVSVDTLTQSLNRFMQSLEPLTKIDAPKDSAFVIDELELTLAVNAKGGIELVGKLEAGVQAGIKIKLKRKTS